MKKTSEAQLRASKKWDENNKERKKYINYRSITKKFIRELASLDDLKDLKEIIKKGERNNNDKYK